MSKQTLQNVLVVDDEPYLLKVLSSLLTDYHAVSRVVTAPGGRKASELLREHADEFDAIICDLHMPEMNGADLYYHVARLHPRLRERMIFITGGSYSASLRDFLSGVSNAVLQKPFSQEQLFQALGREAQ